MYAWGGSTAGWKGSGGYDFGSARADYDKLAAKVTGPRTYTRPAGPDLKLVDARGKTLRSDSTDPIIIGIDVTGSMSAWPGEIFDRLPLFYQTLAKYRPNAEFGFAAIGDATCDSYPLQVNDFGKGPDLEKKVKALYPEGGGGGHITESYELFGHFMLNHCETPKATSPFLLIYGDEAFYPQVSPAQVKRYIGDTLEKPVESRDVWQGLLQKFNVYYLQKPYGSGGDTAVTREVRKAWSEVLGPQRVIALPSMERSVDVAMGLIAKHWGEYDDFKGSLDARHDDPDVKRSVHYSLRHVDADPPATSVTRGASAKASKVTKSLLDR